MVAGSSGKVTVAAAAAATPAVLVVRPASSSRLARHTCGEPSQQRMLMPWTRQKLMEMDRLQVPRCSVRLTLPSKLPGTAAPTEMQLRPHVCLEGVAI